MVACREGWDHDRCEFCWREFSDSDYECGGQRSLAEGYVAADENYHWICPKCFEDFRERFRWTMIE